MSIAELAKEAADRAWAEAFVAAFPLELDGRPLAEVKTHYNWSFSDLARSILLAERYGVIAVEGNGQAEVVRVTERGHRVIARNAELAAKAQSKAQWKAQRPHRWSRRPPSNGLAA